MEKISVIVVTYQRPEELKKCIESIKNQTYLPAEIIVIDNGSSASDSSKKSCKKSDGIIPIKYIDNAINSLPAARNLGVAFSNGEYVLLVDDDVTLANNYIETIIKIFIDNEEIMGVQGYIHQSKRPLLREYLHRIFGHFHLESNKCRVLKSISTTYPKNLNKTIECEWISGANQMYRKKVLEEVLWDEKLMKYADGEDLDHSYRVFLRYPKKLLITPNASVLHSEAINGRTLKKELIFMREVYGWYLNNKLFPNSMKAKFKFIWSRFGRLIFSIMIFIKYRNTSSYEEIKNIFDSYIFVYKNRRMIAAGDLNAFHHMFKI